MQSAHSLKIRRFVTKSGSVRIGIDIGGTFTDIVAARGREVVGIVKLQSTPGDYSNAILDGLGRLLGAGRVAPEEVSAVVHGTTVATNSILEGRGAKAALITTRGFRDVLELRRIRTPELYNFWYEKPPPLVPRRFRLEVTERLEPDGCVVTPLDEEDVYAALGRCVDAEIEALAISFLHSYANPEHEKRVADLARRTLGGAVFVTASHEILPEIREYERTSTTVVNAYVGPVVRAYLQRIAGVLQGLGIAAPLRIMQSNGGTLGLDAVLRVPAAIVESGPAAGVVGGALIALTLASPDAITIDMGGTTAKAALIQNGSVARTSEYEVGAGISVSSQLVKGRGHALRLPVIDISEIGAGGGSLAVVDSAGRLLVGPNSAGSVPGPVAYGRGGRVATLTDALVTLGYVSSTSIAGGAVPIEGEAAIAAVTGQIAEPLGVVAHHAAQGIYLVAGAVMTRAVKAVSTFRGRDPRECTLIAFGGNGALMAPQIADELGIRTIVVPPLPGLFSACGLIVAPNERELVHSLFGRLRGVSQATIREVLERLADRARRELVEDGSSPEAIETEYSADLRYAGQAYELTVGVAARHLDGDLVAVLAAAFHDEHERTFGHSSPQDPVDLVSLRVIAHEASPLADLPTFDYADTGQSPGVTRDVFFGSEAGVRPTPIISRSQLRRRGESPGPLIIEEYDATAVVPPGWRARLDDAARLVLTRQS